MEKLKVSKKVNSVIKMMLEFSTKESLLDEHVKMLSDGGWQIYKSLNELSYEQMRHALTYGFEVEEIPNYEEIKSTVYHLCNYSGWTKKDLLQFRSKGKFHFKGKGVILNDMTYEQFESVIKRMKSEKITNNNGYTIEKLQNAYKEADIKLVETSDYHILNDTNSDEDLYQEELKSIMYEIGAFNNDNYLSAAIDVALDNGDKQKFMELTGGN